MAALQCSLRPSKSFLWFHRAIDRVDTPSITFLHFRLVRRDQSIHFTSWFRNNVRLLLRQSLYPVHASNGSSEGSNVTKSSEAAKGPPFLTILAGFLVFAAVCWVIGSIVMWLISLIFQSK